MPPPRPTSSAARRLSAARRAAAGPFAARLQRELADLSMPHADVSFRFQEADGEGEWSASGIDRAELLLSANPGEAPRPLARVASGGELSRVMLAVKVLDAPEASGRTLIFDEVDAGIGGRVADSVGARLRALSDHAQVLCVTHLPQVAAYADAHIHISKRVTAGRTLTSAAPLRDEARVEELARMMAGDTSAAMLDGARALLQAKAKGESRRGESEAAAKGESESAGRTTAEKARDVARKYLVEAYGCQMNMHDGERLAGLLESAGFEATADPADADVIVINTCSVRERAEEKLFTRLGEFREAAQAVGHTPVIAVTGCVAQQEGAALLKRSRLIDVVIGTQQVKQLPMLVTRALDEDIGPQVDINPHEDVSFPLGIARRG